MKGESTMNYGSLPMDKITLDLCNDIIDARKKILDGMEYLPSVKVEVGTTPHEVVYREDKMRLLHYIPEMERTSPVPVLISYALVNRQYMLDLQPDRSVVRNLLRQGLDLYMVDWGYPTKADRYLSLDDYVNGYLDHAVEYIRERSGQERINLMGICQGGTFCVMYCALHPEKVKNLVTLVTPVAFGLDRGLLYLWAKDLDIDRMVDSMGIIPGDFLNVAFLLMNPVRLAIDKYMGFFEKIDDEEFVKNFLRMEKWIFDSPAQAGEAFRQFVKDCFKNDLLIQNKMEIGGKRIDLRRITAPLLNVYAQYDHLVPPESSRPLNDAVGSTDKESLMFPTGHIGIFVSSKSQKEVCPRVGSWLLSRMD
jgi:polyhydroxyalkanoate synthase